MELNELKAKIAVPSGLSPEVQKLVRQSARQALQNKFVRPGETVPFQAPLPLSIEVQPSTAGQVTAKTLIELTTTATTTKQGEENVFFQTTLAPQDRLRAIYESIAGLGQVKNEMLDSMVLMARHRAQLGDVAHHVGMTGKFLFAGKPGTAKTSLARGLPDAFARLAKSPVAVHEVNCTRLLNKYVGESAKNVGSLFDKLTQACAEYPYSFVIFDEYDALAGDRTNEQEHPEARRAVNALLMAKDRLSFFEHRAFVIAITNIAHKLDPAIVRRFDKIVEFGMPGVPMRQTILQHKLAQCSKRLGIQVTLTQKDFTNVARATNGYSGADLARLAGKAVMLALADARVINKSCIADALKQIKPAAHVNGRKKK